MKKGCTPSCQVLKGPLKNIMQRRWQVGEELRGGGEPVFVTCSLPRLPVACTSLGLRNAGKMSKERGVGRQVRCFAEVWLGEAGPRGKWRQGKRRGKGSKSSTLGAVAQVGWDPKTRGSKQEPRRRGRQSPGFPAGHQGWPRLLVGAFFRNWSGPCLWGLKNCRHTVESRREQEGIP